MFPTRDFLQRFELGFFGCSVTPAHRDLWSWRPFPLHLFEFSYWCPLDQLGGVSFPLSQVFLARPDARKIASNSFFRFEIRHA